MCEILQGGRGGICLSYCELLKKKKSYFEILESSIFLLIILVVFNFIFYVKGGGFALVDFESFLFYYFKVPKFSIFLLVILWVFKKHCVKFHKGRERGYLPFFLKIFCFCILKFQNF